MMIAVYDEVIVMKTNASGEMIWGRSSAMGPPDEGGKNPGFEWLAVPGDGGLVASKAENDFSLLRYSEEGDLMWNKTYSLGSYTHGKTIARSPNGNLLIAGFVDYVPHIMELSDEDGSVNWIKTFEGGGSMTLLSKSHLTVMGESIILDFTTTDNIQYIVELNVDGEVIGINTFKRTSSEGLNFAVSIVDILQQIGVKRPPSEGTLNACGNVATKTGKAPSVAVKKK